MTSAPGPSQPRPFRVTGILLAAAACFVIYLGWQTGTGPEPPLRLSLDVPGEISLGGTGKKIAVPVTLTLHNPRGAEAALSAESDCTIHRWMLLSEQGDLVAAKAGTCPAKLVERTLAPGDDESYQTVVELPRDRLEAGRHYVLAQSYWGQKADSVIKAGP